MHFSFIKLVLYIYVYSDFKYIKHFLYRFLLKQTNKQMKAVKKPLDTFACFRQTPSSLLLPAVQPRYWKMQEGSGGAGSQLSVRNLGREEK